MERCAEGSDVDAKALSERLNEFPSIRTVHAQIMEQACLERDSITVDGQFVGREKPD
jgi:hypothetical protein